MHSDIMTRNTTTHCPVMPSIYKCKSLYTVVIKVLITLNSIVKIRIRQLLKTQILFLIRKRKEPQKNSTKKIMISIIIL